jgi:lipoate-protein ligase A
VPDHRIQPGTASQTAAPLERSGPFRAISVADNFASDERLLRSERPAVRVGVLLDRAVSYGVGVRRSAPFLGRAAALSIPTIRRSTGGSGLLHLPGDLVWSIVLPRADHRVGRDFLRAYSRLGRGAVRFLDRYGLSAAWKPAPGSSAEYCTLSERGEVLCVRDRIVGGAAQHLTGSALLHQGTISTDLDRPMIHRLFALDPSGPAGQLESLRGLGVRTGPQELAAGLLDALRTEFGLG